HGDGEVISKEFQQKNAAGQCKWHRKENVECFFRGVIRHVEQNENDDKNDGYDDLQSLLRANLVFVLAAPFDVITRRHANAFSDNSLCFIHKSADVATADIHQDSPAQQTILARNHRRAHHDSDMGNVSQRDLRSVRSGDEDIRERFDVFAKIPRIPHPNRETLASFDGKCDIFATNRRFDDVLGIPDIDSISGGCGSIDANIKVWSPGDSLSVEICSSRHSVQNAFDLDGFLFDRLQIRAKHFQAYLRTDACG